MSDEQSLPENYGKPIDEATFAILLAEIEKSMRKLRTLAHINRNLIGIGESIRHNNNTRFQVLRGIATNIDYVLDNAANEHELRQLLLEWRDRLSREDALITPRRD